MLVTEQTYKHKFDRQANVLLKPMRRAVALVHAPIDRPDCAHTEIDDAFSLATSKVYETNNKSKTVPVDACATDCLESYAVG